MAMNKHNCLKHFSSGPGDCILCANELGQARMIIEMQGNYSNGNFSDSLLGNQAASNANLQSIGAGIIPTEPQPKTLRDEFAMAALGGVCAHADTWGLQLNEICNKSYEIADAMMKAREATK